MSEDEFVLYGLVGRAVIEQAATLRYYLQDQFQPIVMNGSGNRQLDSENLCQLDDLLDRCMRGQRYDWRTMLRDHLSGRVPPQTHKPDVQQVNALTCVERWSRLEPRMAPLYSLFCDLVHPNLGSGLMVLRLREDGISVGTQRGEPLGCMIVQMTLSLLADIVQRVVLVLGEVDDAGHRFAVMSNGFDEDR